MLGGGGGRSADVAEETGMKTRSRVRAGTNVNNTNEQGQDVQ